MTVGLIDYGAGNLHSVENALNAIGYQPRLIGEPEQLSELTHLILPGVGAFGDCAEKLQAQRLFAPIRDWIHADKPFFGICVGLQILMESSEESPGAPGLGVFPGTVKRFPSSQLKVPHMGWNPLVVKEPGHPIWSGIPTSPHFYFVHSYYAQPADSESDSLVAHCDYGIKFCAALHRGRLFATQFHPEKSQQLGQTLLRNFLNLPS